MILIADSGSTKTSWRAIYPEGEVKALESGGLNPVFMQDDQIIDVLETVQNAFGAEASKIHFYGAGVLGSDQRDRLHKLFRTMYPAASIEIASDLLAAARALCGHEDGIACIIGTGSNSCLYDGEMIIEKCGGGGFILGDEGSGAYFGRRMISDYIHNLMPGALADDLCAQENMSYNYLIDRVYRQPEPSRYLASFMPFISKHRSNAYFVEMLQDGFREFLRRNTSGYDTAHLKIGFVGSVAYYFNQELAQAVEAEGLKLGQIIKAPIDSLVEYHKIK